MADPHHERVQQVFTQASALPPADRAAFLDQACLGDTRLRAEVESLLAHADHAGSDFLAPLSTMAAGNEATLDAGSAPRPKPNPFAVRDDLVGQTLGPYRLLAIVGTGGMGTVYEAQQTKPVRRRVALKLVKLGMDTREVVARFEGERQALALMNHPNVAAVYDAGATEQGRPYFVMEYVPGEPITAYCDKHRLSLPDRLNLFMQVCHAVQHAHQKGLIHRDIKPTNVLVMLQDGKPVPKVIDFGVAKATNQRLAENTVFTEMGQLIGTPEYMSPEQAEMSQLDIDTRTDVYSLGVLLYELLTGALPFDSKTLRARGYAEIQRIIREVEPPRPSTRLSGLTHAPSGAEGDQGGSHKGRGSVGDSQRRGEGIVEGEPKAGEEPVRQAPAHGSLPDRSTLPSCVDDVAARRQTDARTLIKRLRGDLDWIVMKCLEKDRTHRYDTASSLALELQRYLNNEPVTAGARTLGYRVRKFVRRNRAAVFAVSAIAISLLAGFSGTFWLWRVAKRAEIEQRRLTDDAEKKTIQLAQANARLYSAALFGTQSAINEGRIKEAKNLIFNEFSDRSSPMSWELRYLSAIADSSVLTMELPAKKTSHTISHCPKAGLVACNLCSELDDTLIVYRIITSPDGRSGIEEMWRQSYGAGQLGVSAFSRDGETLAVAVNHRQTHQFHVDVWRLADQSFQREAALEMPEGLPPAAMVFSQDGLDLFAGATIVNDSRLVFWRRDRLTNNGAFGAFAEASRRIRSLADLGPIADLSMDQQDRWLAVLHHPRSVVDILDHRELIGNPDSQGMLLARLSGHKYWGLGIGFTDNPAGDRLVTASADLSVKLWSVSTAIERAKRIIDQGSYDNGSELLSLRIDNAPPRCVQLTESGGRIIAGGDDRMVRVWDIFDRVENGGETAERPGSRPEVTDEYVLRGHNDQVTAIGDGGNGFVLSKSTDQTLKLWYPGAESVVKLEGHQTSLNSVTFSPDHESRWLASSDGMGWVIIWDRRRGVPMYADTNSNLSAKQVCWWPDPEPAKAARSWLAIASGIAPLSSSNVPHLRIVEMDEKGMPTAVASFRAEPTGIASGEGFWCVRATKNGRRLAAGGADGNVYIWNFTGVPKLDTPAAKFNVVNRENGCIMALAFIDDAGDWIATTEGHVESSSHESTEHSVRIWRADTGLEAAGSPYAQHGGFVATLAINPEGALLASGSTDNTIVLWKIAMEAGIPRLEMKQRLNGHTNAVAGLAFHPTEPRLASSSQDHTVKIWSLDPGATLLTLRGPLGAVQAVAFDNSGESLAATSVGSQGTDNRLWLWTTDDAPARIARAKAMRVNHELSRFSGDRALLRMGADALARRLPWLREECERTMRSLP